MRLLMIAAMALVLSGCAGNVVTDYNPSAVFGNYSTWSFARKRVVKPLCPLMAAASRWRLSGN